MSTAEIVTENVLADLDRVLFTTPEAHTERVRARNEAR